MALKKWVPSQLWTSFMNDYNTNVDELTATTESHNLALADTGWQTADLTSEFKPYSSVEINTPEYRKIGKTVHIRGVVSPVNELPYSLTNIKIFNLPSDFIPSKDLHIICQGLGLTRWLLTIMSNGDVFFARYGDGSAQSAPTTAWLPFNATYFID